MAQEPKSSKPSHAKTLNELAQILGCSIRTVKRLRGRGLEAESGKGYPVDVAESLRRPQTAIHIGPADREGSRPRAGETASSAEPSSTINRQSQEKLAEQALRYRRAKADGAEMDNQIRRGELVARDEVVEGWVRRVLEVRNTLMALPGRLSKRLAEKSDHEVFEILHRQMATVLDRFAREGTVTPGGLDELLTKKEDPPR